MAVHYMTELTRFGFALGVLFTVIGTRMPFDPSYGTIGGSLSYPFRVLLLSSCVAKALRNFGQGFLPFWTFLWPILYVADGCLMTWLFMATPYLLRSFMRDRINIGSPGRPLQAWLIGLSLTQATGLISIIAFADDRIWALIRLAGAASSIPVLQALQQYNLLTTPTGPYRGRGMAVTQALARYERFFQLVMIVAAIGDFYQVGETIPTTDDLYKHRSMLQFYWLRAALHGLFINMLDEMEQVVPVPTSDPNEDNRDEPDGEMSTAFIPSPVSGRSH